MSDSALVSLEDAYAWVDWVPNPCALLTADRSLLRSNSAFHDLFLACQKSAVVETSDSPVAIASFAQLQQAIAHLESSRETIQIRVFSEEGIERHFTVRSRTLPLNHQGDALKLLTLEDRTALRAVEAALSKSESRTVALLQGAVDPIVIISEQGRIKSFNPAAEGLFGYSADEVLGENVRMLMPPPYREEHDSYLARYLRTGQRRVIGIGREVIGQRKDGTTFPMELSISEINDPEHRLFVGTVRDLTKAKRAEQALRNSESRGRAILNTAVDAIITIDETGLIKSLNPAAQTMFGYRYEELLGENVSTLMPAPYQQEHDGYLANYVRTGIRKVIGIGREATGRRKDGSTFPMELSVSETQQGEKRFFTGIVRDITQRKQNDERLCQAMNDAIAARARSERQSIELELQSEALRLAQERAEQANTAKSQFLANMSHEIRTPLTAILGFSDLMLTSMASSDELEAAKTIKKNAEHLLTVINDILDLSKIEAGKLEVERRDCSPYNLAIEVCDLLRLRADAKQLPLLLEFASPLPVSIKTDPTRLRQILLNLVGNAIKFTAKGQVRVRLEFLDSLDESWLRIEVHDTGVGLTPKQVAQLFQPFMQADVSTTRIYGGTGLGLTICKRLVELLGGSIDVRSQEGHGSVFAVRLPTGPVEGPLQELFPLRETPPALLAPCAARLDGMRLLLADDGVDNRRLITRILHLVGASVTTAEDGQQACAAVAAAAARGEPFDAIILDMQMPVLDGYGTARWLRENGYTGSILALTANAMSWDRDCCIAAGCSHYTTKPIDRVKLLELLASFRDSNQPAHAE